MDYIRTNIYIYIFGIYHSLQYNHRNLIPTQIAMYSCTDIDSELPMNW